MFKKTEEKMKNPLQLSLDEDFETRDIVIFGSGIHLHRFSLGDMMPDF